MLVFHSHSCTGMWRGMYLIIHIPNCGFPEDLFQSRSRDRVESDQPEVPWFLFFSFLEDRHEIYKQSSGTSSDCHDFSKLIESGLAMTLISFINTLRFIPSGPMHFFMWNFLKWLLTSSSSTVLKCFALTDSTTSPRDLRPEFTSKNVGKPPHWIHQDFCIFCHRVSDLNEQWDYIFLILPFTYSVL